jgi:hypothetical protein
MSAVTAAGQRGTVPILFGVLERHGHLHIGIVRAP